MTLRAAGELGIESHFYLRIIIQKIHPNLLPTLSRNLDFCPNLKGQCHEIICFRFFSWIFFPQAPEITLGSFRILSKIRGEIRKWRCTTGINDTGGRQILPLVLLALLKPGGKFATGVNEGNSTTQSCSKKIMKTFLIEDFFICHWCQQHRWCTLSCKYPREFSKKFETTLIVYTGAWGKLIHKKS